MWFPRMKLRTVYQHIKLFALFLKKKSTIHMFLNEIWQLFFIRSAFIFLKYQNLFKWQTFRTQQSMLSISFIMLRVDFITAFISHTSYFTQSWSAIFTADLSMQTLEYVTEVRLPCTSFSVNTESIWGTGLKSIVDIDVFMIICQSFHDWI